MTTTDTSPRIYVACLAAYNNGALHGAWIDLDGKDADDIHAAIGEMLKNSPEPGAEEWAIHDYELPYGIRIDENPDLSELVELVEMLEKHGEAFALYRDHIGADYATLRGFEDAFQGVFKSAEDYAEDFIAQTCDLSDVPDIVKYHIDYAGIARDFECGGDVALCDGSDGMTYVFSNH